jgi:hypothetical protein
MSFQRLRPFWAGLQVGTPASLCFGRLILYRKHFNSNSNIHVFFSNGIPGIDVVVAALRSETESDEICSGSSCIPFSNSLHKASTPRISRNPPLDTARDIFDPPVDTAFVSDCRSGDKFCRIFMSLMRLCKLKKKLIRQSHLTQFGTSYIFPSLIERWIRRNKILTYFDSEFCKSPSDMLPCPGCLMEITLLDSLLTSLIIACKHIPRLHYFVYLVIRELIPEMVTVCLPPRIDPIHSIVEQVILFYNMKMGIRL